MRGKCRIIEETLRDGCHGLKNAPSNEQVQAIAAELDRAGVYAVDVGQGLGLSQDSGTLEYIRAARKTVKRAKICTLIVPGYGTIEMLCKAAEAGLDMVRIAVVCNRVDTSVDYIKKARELELETGVFLMASHILQPNELADQSKEAEDAGAEFICLGDSIGAMVQEEVVARIKAIQNRVKIPVGIHVHNSLGLAVANTVAAVREGCLMADCSLEGLGADSGNANLQAVAAVCRKSGISLEVDFKVLNRIAEQYVRPLMDRPLELRGNEIETAYDEIFPDALRPFM